MHDTVFWGDMHRTPVSTGIDSEDTARHALDASGGARRSAEPQFVTSQEVA
ncbi:MAG: hypothetical protein ACQETI_11350 [Halobacteriota archaeon]